MRGKKEVYKGWVKRLRDMWWNNVKGLKRRRGYDEKKSGEVVMRGNEEVCSGLLNNNCQEC